MINRLVYEVRLNKTLSQPKVSKGKPWRWDVIYYVTTDPTYPGVEDGRLHIGSNIGYERWQWQARKKIADNILYNKYKDKYEVR